MSKKLNIMCLLHMISTQTISCSAIESLAECPSLMTHASVPDDQRALLGIDDTLIRLSVGIESCKDLVEDLKHALQIAFQSVNDEKER